MKSRIIQLPDHLISRIAAGEVVERPASVLKELIENSLDSGATDISVALEGAGRNLLVVSDNGCGMNKEEARLSLQRHATSKISRLEDLESIASYGFRGEALPSIASVSRFRMTTRNRTEASGWELILEGGKLISQKPVAREPGTTIEARDLFFNTPARFKFMKSDATERSQCLRVIEEMAFAALPVTFRARVEKAKPLVFQGNSPLTLRVPAAWGTRFNNGFVEVEETTPHFGVMGVVSHPHYHQGTTRTQFLYVNRRPVQNRRLVRALYDAYLGRLPTMRHPAWVLFLTLNPQTVDVNVHPTKREVKLTHESELFGFLRHAVKKALETKDVGAQHAAPVGNDHLLFRAAHAPPLQHPVAGAPAAAGAQVREKTPPLFGSPPWRAPLPLSGMKTLQALAQVHNTYILAQSESGVVIIDQHAAAERVLYERLLKNFREQEPPVQMLLIPFSWEVALSLYPAVHEKLPALRSMGFVIEPFGDNTFLIKGYPGVLGDKCDLGSLLDGLSEVFVDGGEARQGHHVDFQHRLAALAACKASVKAGDAMNLKECQTLLDQNLACQAPLTCPHGRPASIELTYSELERRFRRK